MPPPRPLQRLADEQAALRESLHGPITLQDRLEGGDEPSYLRSGVANSVLRDLRRGRWAMQDEIDLHGLNREEARGQLATFLVRGWLAQKNEILAYCQAKPQDGGEGAVIVLLRTQRQTVSQP
jgi:DNA-nicking Smr family endonuclease